MKNTLPPLLMAALLLTAALPMGCKTKTMKQENRFHWGTGISVPNYYPAHLLSGAFFMKDGGVRSIYPEEVISGPWGINNTVTLAGGGVTDGSAGDPPPEKLYVLWLSIAENKFYQGTFAVDSARLRDALDRGFREHRVKRPVEGHHLVVGLAPEGRVTLWIDGGDDASQLELGSYQGIEAPQSCVSYLEDELDKYLYPAKKTPEHVPATEADFLAAMVRNRQVVMEMSERRRPGHYERYGLRHGHLDTCHLRYNTRTRMVYEDTTAGNITDELYIHYVNGEREVIVLDELAENPLRMRAVPREIHCFWSQPGKYRHYEIHLDEEEAIEAYRKAASELHEGGIDLQLLRNEEQDYLRLFLVYCDGEDSFRRLQLKRAHIDNYQCRKAGMIQHYETYKQKNKGR